MKILTAFIIFLSLSSHGMDLLQGEATHLAGDASINYLSSFQEETSSGPVIATVSASVFSLLAIVPPAVLCSIFPQGLECKIIGAVLATCFGISSVVGWLTTYQCWRSFFRSKELKIDALALAKILQEGQDPEVQTAMIQLNNLLEKYSHDQPELSIDDLLCRLVLANQAGYFAPKSAYKYKKSRDLYGENKDIKLELDDYDKVGMLSERDLKYIVRFILNISLEELERDKERFTHIIQSYSLQMGDEMNLRSLSSDNLNFVIIN